MPRAQSDRWPLTVPGAARRLMQSRFEFLAEGGNALPE
jgi:hypothetical protein